MRVANLSGVPVHRARAQYATQIWQTFGLLKARNGASFVLKAALNSDLETLRACRETTYPQRLSTAPSRVEVRIAHLYTGPVRPALRVAGGRSRAWYWTARPVTFAIAVLPAEYKLSSWYSASGFARAFVAGKSPAASGYGRVLTSRLGRDTAWKKGRLRWIRSRR